MNPAILLVIALSLTGMLATGSLFAGFVAAMPDGTVAYGITPRLRIELYLSSAMLLFGLGHMWLTLVPHA